ncbi:hypothetical protein [Mycolicibacterium sp.]|uniref:hypothetical protein n=1 Tax=Mycolicibacterium sp. TaxID=2320850 RepID=UPI001A340FED|nr:hypothetical protein [Mycolicibacterium sp.]MBJ7336210.1 hypothetical protein [Mycolicibacterium sp.]
MAYEAGTSKGLALRQPGATPNWRRGVYGGAVVGGLFWGLVAGLTIGAPGDAASHAANDGHRMVVATAVWIVLAAAGATLARFGWHRHLRSLGLMLVIGPTGGWLIFGSLAAQGALFGWGMS